MSGGNRADAVDGRNEIDRHLFVCYLLFFMIASYAAVGAACLVPAAVLVFLRFLDPVRLLEKIYPSRHSVMLQQVLIIGLLVIAVYLSVPGRAAGGGRRWAAEISPWAVIWASALSLAIGRRRRMLFMPAVGLAALFLVNGTKSGGLSYPILTLSAALTATVCGRALQMSRSPVAARKGHWLAVGLYGGAAVLLLGIPMA
ncbi:MAG: hypothetical protein JW909_10920, partial [Planctomycetes bacterium]|nr:hypothetical protein [Planctomycetota bacterium]